MRRAIRPHAVRVDTGVAADGRCGWIEPVRSGHNRSTRRHSREGAMLEMHVTRNRPGLRRTSLPPHRSSNESRHDRNHLRRRGSARGWLHGPRPRRGYSHQAEAIGELHEQVRDAVRCHFDPEAAPRLIRLHLVRDEVIAA